MYTRITLAKTIQNLDLYRLSFCLCNFGNDVIQQLFQELLTTDCRLILVYVPLQGTDSVPPGFEPISLLEALNGQQSVSPAIPSAPLYDDINFSGGPGGESRQLSSPEHLSDGSLQKGKVSKSPDRYSLPVQEIGSGQEMTCYEYVCIFTVL